MADDMPREFTYEEYLRGKYAVGDLITMINDGRTTRYWLLKELATARARIKELEQKMPSPNGPGSDS